MPVSCIGWKFQEQFHCCLFLQGHLLVLESLGQIYLRHGLMEFAYEKLADSSDTFGIASTATIDAEGRLLLGILMYFNLFGRKII